MRTYLKYLALSGIALSLLASCKKGDVLPVTNGGTAGTLTASATTLVLDKTKISDTTKVINFTLTNANYGYQSTTTVTLQLDVASDNWASPQSVTVATKQLTQGFSTTDFNALMLKLSLPTGTASQVSARISYSVGVSVKTIYSNVVTLTVTPFNLVSFVYVPGAYQGWKPETADSLISTTGNGVYTGIINFTAGNLTFKITPAKTFTNSYGSTNGSDLVYNGGSDIPAPAAGMTWVTVNVNSKTITFTPVTHYFAIIGSATAGGWDNDTDMKYDNGNQYWTVTAPLTTGTDVAFKIRADHKWDLSYGTIKTPDGVTLTSANGGNLSVTAAGTYKINFNVSAADATVATYTLTKQ